MSSGTTDSSDANTIPIHRRALDRLETDVPVVIEYRSNRGNKSKKKHRGVITSVEALGKNKCRFRFYDEDAERKITVTLRETYEGSSVKSQKTGNPSTVGTPILVLAAEDCTNPEAVWQEYLISSRNDEFDSVIAAAAIANNKREIAWIRTVETNE